MRLEKNKIRFTAYSSETELSVMSRVKLVIKNESDKKINAMTHIVEGAKDSLLGQKDGKN